MTTLLFLLGLRWLPAREPARGVYDRAHAAGGVPAARARLRASRSRRAPGMAVARLRGDDARRSPSARRSSSSSALPGGGGRNVVNVMLVDFRGFDTFGEGVVLALVALTVYALLRRFRPAPEVHGAAAAAAGVLTATAPISSSPRHGAATPRPGYLLVPRGAGAGLLLPVSGVVAAFFFLRGHNAPGGGFVAGLVMAIGLARCSTSSPARDWVEERVRSRPAR